MKNLYFVLYRFLYFSGLTLLTACGENKDLTEIDGARLNQNIERDSYELILIRRPTSVEEYFKLWSIPYKLCAATAELKKIPVKPFPHIPKDFVMIRTVITSDGKSFRTTEEEFGVDIQDMSVENGCQTSYGSGIKTWVAHNGLEIDLGSEGQAEEEGERATYQLKPYDAGFAQGYSTIKKINGISVRCTNDRDLMVAAKVVSEICVLDPVLGRIAMADGKPPIVYTRDVPGPSLFGSAMIGEPISLRVGIKVDPNIFINSGAK